MKRPGVCWEEVAVGGAIREQCLSLSETCVIKRDSYSQEQLLVRSIQRPWAGNSEEPPSQLDWSPALCQALAGYQECQMKRPSLALTELSPQREIAV